MYPSPWQDPKSGVPPPDIVNPILRNTSIARADSGTYMGQSHYFDILRLRPEAVTSHAYPIKVNIHGASRYLRPAYQGINHRVSMASNTMPLTTELNRNLLVIPATEPFSYSPLPSPT